MSKIGQVLLEAAYADFENSMQGVDDCPCENQYKTMADLMWEALTRKKVDDTEIPF